MTVLIQLVALPAVFLFWLGWLHAAGKRTGIRISLILFALSYAAGLWSVVRSQPSATNTHLLLLPYEATLAGVLGLAFAYGWASKNTARRVAGRLCLTAAALLIGSQVLV